MRILSTLLLVVAATPLHATPGAGELTLDRASVRAWVAAALPDTVRVAGFELLLEPPRSIDFDDGAVQVAIGVRVAALDWNGTVIVRYAPRIDPLDGSARLEPIEAEGLPFGVLEPAWLPAVELPRRFAWEIAGAKVTGFVQAIEVGDERLRVAFGLQVAASRPPAAPPSKDRSSR